MTTMMRSTLIGVITCLTFEANETRSLSDCSLGWQDVCAIIRMMITMTIIISPCF